MTEKLKRQTLQMVDVEIAKLQKELDEFRTARRIFASFEVDEADSPTDEDLNLHADKLMAYAMRWEKPFTITEARGLLKVNSYRAGQVIDSLIERKEIKVWKQGSRGIPAEFAVAAYVAAAPAGEEIKPDRFEAKSRFGESDPLPIREPRVG